MKYLLSRSNWLSIFVVSCIAVFYTVSILNPNIWEASFYEVKFKTMFFKTGFYLTIGLIFIEIIRNNKELFSKKDVLRNVIVFFGAVSFFLFTYKEKITYRIEILVLFLCLVCCIWERKYYKPNLIIISFLIFIVFKTARLVILNEHYDYVLRKFEISYYFLLIAPFLALFFRIKEKEYSSLVTLCFKAFLWIMALSFCSYMLYIASLKMPFFSFFTFNKGYLYYYEVLGWSVYRHPSFISWVYLLIGGLAYFVSRKNSNLITKFEFVLYFILLLFFVFIVQSRFGMVGYFFVISFFVYDKVKAFFSERVNTIMIYTSVILIILVSLYSFLHSGKEYFSDNIRKDMYVSAINQIRANIFLGRGSMAQLLFMEETGLSYVHNDFLATIMDLGVVGLFLLLSWIFSTTYVGIKRNNSIVFAMFIFFLMMNAESMLSLHFNFLLDFSFLTFILFRDFETDVKNV